MSETVTKFDGKGILVEGSEEALKEAELEMARRLHERREAKRRRRGEPVVCSVCGDGRTTLYAVSTFTPDGMRQTEKRCGRHS